MWGNYEGNKLFLNGGEEKEKDGKRRVGRSVEREAVFHKKQTPGQQVIFKREHSKWCEHRALNPQGEG